ncbi:efflux RND transporter periplasmic adaptor subunit [Candidatus Thiothrix sp. Deng01]|uniref:Efflux RND transporter periplasmic adaptor subunit n=1 Tax=Candidatus Thiothrix phosphatis TaxID=3112415 RepID=A0ABU6CUX7_9GAMM|nr:efflux RND transporter periplasmic adaptor subunit [Candidatus Thiothrix sp. Deng01]MEB4590634.1 efflux RND transporter periplasmic adaptor subunit [Candidatus Thiothrix sp. Deng01]
MSKTLFALFIALPIAAQAADTVPVPAEQRAAMGIESAPITSSATGLGMEVTAKVILPPDSVRVLAAPTDGLVTTLRYQSGETVKAGAPLVSLSSPDLIEARRQYVQATLKYRLAADNASRDKRLADQGLIAKNTWLLTQNEVALAKSDVETAAATIRLLGAKPDSESSEITLVSPINGWVIETLVEPGQRVEAPEALVKIGNLLKLGLEIPLPLDKAHQLSTGQRVEVADTGIQGEITVLKAALDASQNMLVRADIEQPDTVLHPGQSVKVRILGQSGQGSTQHVPASSIAWVTDKAYVFVETADGFIPTAVKVQNQNGEDASISGLAPDSKVAVKGVAALKAKWQEGGE